MNKVIYLTFFILAALPYPNAWGQKANNNTYIKSTIFTKNDTIHCFLPLIVKEQQPISLLFFRLKIIKYKLNENDKKRVSINLKKIERIKHGNHNYERIKFYSINEIYKVIEEGKINLYERTYIDTIWDKEYKEYCIAKDGEIQCLDYLNFRKTMLRFFEDNDEIVEEIKTIRYVWLPNRIYSMVEEFNHQKF